MPISPLLSSPELSGLGCSELGVPAVIEHPRVAVLARKRYTGGVPRHLPEKGKKIGALGRKRYAGSVPR